VIARMGHSWQVMLADLSLILFIVTAAALGDEGASATRQAAPPALPTLPAQSEPVAVFRPAPGAGDFAQWLKDRGRDHREQLTIVVHYPPGQRASVANEASRMAETADAAGIAARMVIEPGSARDISAVFAFDISAAGHGQSGMDLAVPSPEPINPSTGDIR